MIAYVLGSGSSGNCIVMEVSGERIVLDAGLNPTLAARRMRSLGGELITKGAPLGIFITHHHADHVVQALPLARALHTQLYVHDGIDSHHLAKAKELRRYSAESETEIGPFRVAALPLPHDAPQMALRVTAGDCSFGLVTDLGHAPPSLAAFLSGCDVVLLESNHCPVMMTESSYPEHLRQRILGPVGHLSNEQAAEIVRTIPPTRLRRVVFGHLSRVANTKGRTEEVHAASSLGVPFDVLSRDSAARIDVREASFTSPAPLA